MTIMVSTIREGWFPNQAFQGTYQKVNGRVYVYVQQMFGGWKVQLYERGNVWVCECEARTANDSPDKLLDLGELWLDRYADGDMENIHKDRFSIKNPEGVWKKNHYEKEYWI